MEDWPRPTVPLVLLTVTPTPDIDPDPAIDSPLEPDTVSNPPAETVPLFDRLGVVRDIATFPVVCPVLVTCAPVVAVIVAAPPKLNRPATSRVAVVMLPVPVVVNAPPPATLRSPEAIEMSPVTSTVPGTFTPAAVIVAPDCAFKLPATVKLLALMAAAPVDTSVLPEFNDTLLPVNVVAPLTVNPLPLKLKLPEVTLAAIVASAEVMDPLPLIDKLADPLNVARAGAVT